MPYQPNNILVTGGAGFIGSHYIHHIQQHYPHAQIINLDALTYAANLANVDNLPDPTRYHFIKANINDQPLVEKLLDQYAIDTVVHFAAESHVDRSIAGPEIFIESNVLGTQRLCEAAKTVWLDTQQRKANQCRFHHISTDEVYGSLEEGDPAFTEESVYRPNSPYAASKASSDHIVRAYHQTFNLPVTITNCSNNYGAYQHCEKLIPKVVQAALVGDSITVYGSGQQIRDWIHVNDHCQLITKVIEQGTIGEHYNIGGGNEWRNIDLIKLILDIVIKLRADMTNIHSLITHVNDRKGHDYRYAIATNKPLTQFNHRQSFIDKLQQVVECLIEKTNN